MTAPAVEGPRGTARRRIGLYLGPSLFVLALAVPPPPGLPPEAWRVAAVVALMATWWVTEAVPIAVTSLLPVVLFPLLGVAPVEAATAPYANPIVFLFLGGFLLALGMQRSGLHRRIALGVIRRTGTRPRRIVLGVMLATAVLSMWVSNTATAMMMLPIGASVAGLFAATRPGDTDSRAFGTSLMLGVAFAASIGGLGTLIGTPPNALLAAFLLETYGVRVTFARWLLVGVPLVAVLLPLTWLLLTRVAFRVGAAPFPGGGDLIEREVRALGAWSRSEKAVAVVFGFAAALWVGLPAVERVAPGVALSDAGVAIGAATLLFLVPTGARGGGFLLDWGAARDLPWEVLLLFGGGLSLASAMTESGLAAWIGGGVGALGGVPVLVAVVAIVALVVALSELASNTATAAALLPIVGGVAVGLGESPLLLAVPLALGASGGFALPVATPPNAIVYASGHVTLPQMARAGLVLDAVYVVVVSLGAYALSVLVLGVEPGVVPPWAR